MLTSLSNVSEPQNTGGCCSKFGDWSEPGFYVLCAANVVAFGAQLIGKDDSWEVGVSAVAAAAFLVAAWRVRILGVGKKLLKTVQALKNENNTYKLQNDAFHLETEHLKTANKNLQAETNAYHAENKDFRTENEVFRKETQHFQKENEVFDTQNQKLTAQNLVFQDTENALQRDLETFREITNIVGDNAAEAQDRLFETYERYCTENERQENNNLLTLFGLIDRDHSSDLSPAEVGQMSEYVRIVYGEDYDFSQLDTDNDGHVSLQEFFNKFRERKAKPEQPL